MKATTLIVQLSDAQYFLKRAHELAKKIGPYQPETAINARACIMSAWCAVEGITILELRRLRRRLRDAGKHKQFPKALVGKVGLLMLDRKAVFDGANFTRLRDYRNSIAHPPNTPVFTSPPPDWAQEHFDYCVNLSRAMYSADLKF